MIGKLIGFFNKLFGGQDKQPEPDPAQLARYKQFDDEWYAAEKRYAIVVGSNKVHINFKDPKTNEPTAPHVGLKGIIDDWMKTTSLWDRRRLFFDVLFGETQTVLTPWQISNILVAVRQAYHGLQMMQKSIELTPDHENYAQYCEAYARAWQYLQKPEKALPWARKAVEAAPENARMQVRLADALYMTGECDPARKIYTELMASVSKSASSVSSDKAIQKMFTDFFALETGVVHSPVFAIEIGEQLSDPEQSAMFWQLGEDEFYDSPYFRMHHAYRYLHKNDLAHALAKLIALVQEMPWLREPTINAQLLLNKLDPTGEKIMPELRQQMAETIKENGWTTEGMDKMIFEIKPQSES